MLTLLSFFFLLLIIYYYHMSQTEIARNSYFHNFTYETYSIIANEFHLIVFKPHCLNFLQSKLYLLTSNIINIYTIYLLIHIIIIICLLSISLNQLTFNMSHPFLDKTGRLLVILHIKQQMVIRWVQAIKVRVRAAIFQILLFK